MDIIADEAAKIASSQEAWHKEKRPDIATAFGAGAENRSVALQPEG